MESSAWSVVAWHRLPFQRLYSCKNRIVSGMEADVGLQCSGWMILLLMPVVCSLLHAVALFVRILTGLVALLIFWGVCRGCDTTALGSPDEAGREACCVGCAAGLQWGCLVEVSLVVGCSLYKSVGVSWSGFPLFGSSES